MYNIIKWTPLNFGSLNQANQDCDLGSKLNYVSAHSATGRKSVYMIVHSLAFAQGHNYGTETHH